MTTAEDYVAWFNRHHAEMQEWSNAIFNQWVIEAALSVYIDSPPLIEIVVGHDPQKLLPDLSFTTVFLKRFAEGLGLNYADFVKEFGHG